MKKQKKGSNGQKGSHNSKSADHLGESKIFVAVSRHESPEYAMIKPDIINEYPVIERNKLALLELLALFFPHANIRNANAANPSQ